MNYLDGIKSTLSGFQYYQEQLSKRKTTSTNVSIPSSEQRLSPKAASSSSKIEDKNDDGLTHFDDSAKWSAEVIKTVLHAYSTAMINESLDTLKLCTKSSTSQNSTDLHESLPNSHSSFLPITAKNGFNQTSDGNSSIGVSKASFNCNVNNVESITLIWYFHRHAEK